jgi:hypothetical protein
MLEKEERLLQQSSLQQAESKLAQHDKAGEANVIAISMKQRNGSMTF